MLAATVPNRTRTNARHRRLSMPETLAAAGSFSSIRSPDVRGALLDFIEGLADD